MHDHAHSSPGVTRRGLLHAGRAAGVVGMVSVAGMAGITAAACVPSTPPGVGPAPGAALAGTATMLVRTNNNENRYQAEAVVPGVRQAHPGLTVEVIAVPAGTSYPDKYTALQAAGTPPEVHSAYGTSMPDHYYLGNLADLSGYVARDKLDLGAFVPQVKDVIETIYRRGGRLYALPNFTSHGWFVLYNADLLLQAG